MNAEAALTVRARCGTRVGKRWPYTALIVLSLGCSSDESIEPLVTPSVVSTTETDPDYLTKEGIYVTFSQGIGEPALLRLLEKTELHPLRTISIHGQRISAASVNAIMRAESTAALHSLYLQGSSIGDAGLTVMAASPRLAQLNHINLDKVGATSAGVVALAGSPHLKPESLSIGWQAVGDEGAMALAQAAGIQSLHLESAQIGSAGMVALLQGTSAKALTFIGNPAGLQHLSRMSSSIEGLYIKDCGLEASDIQALAQAPAEGLTSLSLKLTSLNDSDLLAITAAPWFKQLDQLVLSAQRTSPSARRALIAAFQGEFLSIYRKDL